MEFRLTFGELFGALKEAGLVIRHSHMPRGQKSAVIRFKAKEVRNGDVFLCYEGAHFDSHTLISQAVSQGASLIILDRASYVPFCQVPYVLVESSRAAWAVLMALGYGEPQKSLKVVGVTGTNGKTSTAFYVRELLRIMGEPCLFLGTIGGYLGEEFFEISHTTPDPPKLYESFARAVELGIKYVVMEVSSIALHQRKLEPVVFEASCFTSFSRDHLDYHKSMGAYLAAKLSLMSRRKTLSMCLMHKDVYEYVENDAGADGFELGHVEVYGDNYEVSPSSDGLGSQFSYGGGSGFVPVLGDYAADNFAAALMLVEGVLGRRVATADWSLVSGVPGRLEALDCHGQILVDYAHTPDALAKTLSLVKSRVVGASRLWVVFGCGGDRDVGKRPLMAEAAALYGDEVIVTSDNPRNEEPEKIIADVVAGFKEGQSYRVEVDRREAIRQGIFAMGALDWLVIAGKGHESYQEVSGKKWPFSDREVAREAWNDRE